MVFSVDFLCFSVLGQRAGMVDCEPFPEARFIHEKNLSFLIDFLDLLPNRMPGKKGDKAYAKTFLCRRSFGYRQGAVVYRD